MDQSIATNQFPQIVWREGEKNLWNPIHRKSFKNRPEERVRLRIIEYLIGGGWSKHRISTEEAVTSQKKKTPLRTDLICYTQHFDPFLLVECKAEQIKITKQTAAQIARYNQNIDAPYLLMSNGIRDYWYKIEDKKNVQAIDAIPSALPALKHPGERSLAYWKARGFAGDNAIPELRQWIQNALNKSLLQNSTRDIRFLKFKNSPSDLDLNNYYVIYDYNTHRLAFTFTATPFGGSRLVAILNKGGQNTGVMEINLDLLFDERPPNASFYSKDNVQNFDLRDQITWQHQPLPISDLIAEINTLIPNLNA